MTLVHFSQFSCLTNYVKTTIRSVHAWSSISSLSRCMGAVRFLINTSSESE